MSPLSLLVQDEASPGAPVGRPGALHVIHAPARLARIARAAGERTMATIEQIFDSADRVSDADIPDGDLRLARDILQSFVGCVITGTGMTWDARGRLPTIQIHVDDGRSLDVVAMSHWDLGVAELGPEGEVETAELSDIEVARALDDLDEAAER